MKIIGSLIDTSVWIEFFRGDPSIKKLLEELVSKDLVFTAGPIVFELLQGIKSLDEKDQVSEALLSVNYLNIISGDWEDAAMLSREMRKKGITLPLTDLLIAQLAKRNNLEVVSFDLHFDQIPGLHHRKPPF